jgi:phytepsin
MLVPQGIVAEINQAINATGLVSGECKLVVKQYADLIIWFLTAEVRPGKICSKLGLCVWAGDNGETWLVQRVLIHVPFSSGQIFPCLTLPDSDLWVHLVFI